MRRVLFAPLAELFECKLALHLFFVLCGVVVRTLARLTLEFEEIVLAHKEIALKDLRF